MTPHYTVTRAPSNPASDLEYSYYTSEREDIFRSVGKS
jgi:hypothetical protein